MISIVLLALISKDPGLAAQCEMIRSPINIVRHFSEVPNAIRKDIQSRIPDLMPENKDARMTDYISNGRRPSRRFVQAIHYNLGWVISYEHGPLHHIHSIGYQYRGGERGILSFEQSQNLVGEPCATFNAIVSGVQAPEQQHM